MNAEDVRNYVERHLRRVLVEPVNITVADGKYSINNTLGYEIYDFWNRTDEELLNDFQDYSFNDDYIGTIFFFL